MDLNFTPEDIAFRNEVRTFLETSYPAELRGKFSRDEYSKEDFLLWQRTLHKQLDPRVVEIAWNAQLRLGRRYARLNARNKPPGKVVTAIARELVGFIWAIGTAVEAQTQHRKAA